MYGRIILCAVIVLASTPITAHSWYPLECCHDQDCTPVDNAWLERGPAKTPEWHVKSKFGTVVIPANFPIRDSMDGHMHICMVRDEIGHRHPLCFFVPPSM